MERVSGLDDRDLWGGFRIRLERVLKGEMLGLPFFPPFPPRHILGVRAPHLVVCCYLSVHVTFPKLGHPSFLLFSLALDTTFATIFTKAICVSRGTPG